MVRHGAIGAALVSALALVAVPGATAPADPDPELLPDLVADPPAHQYLEVDAEAPRLLLRFDGLIRNQGAGPLEIRGSGPVDGRMTTTVQRIYRRSGAFADDPSRAPTMVFEPADLHDHWHLRAAARYSLWSADRAAEVAPSAKVGFCLEDYEAAGSDQPPVYSDDAIQFCGKHQPDAPGVHEGISPGWRDVYGGWLAFQWVDVSDVQPGTYWLKSEVDPEDAVRESDEVNAASFADDATVIPGYLAVPRTVDVAATPTTVALDAQRFGEAGDRRFRIVTPPEHGTLDRPASEDFAGPDVTYTPDPAYRGPDGFTYAAFDASSAFPRRPAPAAVSISVGQAAPAVAISGAPGALTAGTSVQLTATVTGDPPGVRWRGSAGRVSAAGRYVAPADPPSGGTVTIRATSMSGAFAEAVVRILPPPPREAAPSPPGRPVAHGGRHAPVLATPTLARRGRLVVIRTSAWRAGRLRVSVLRGRRTLGRCEVRAPARRAVTCRLAIPRATPSRALTVVLALRVRGRVVAARHVRFGRPAARGASAAAGLVCWVPRRA